MPKRRARSQDKLVAAMRDPSFYPSSPATVTHKETHISHIFFVGDLVYKIKKPVHFSFLDYSTLAKRHRFVKAELRLNRRLAPSVYLAVVPITKSGMSWQLAGKGKAGEYSLVMRRLPEKRMMPFLLERQDVTSGMMRELADFVASFHKRAKRIVPAAPWRYPKLAQRQWDDNLTDLKNVAGESADAEMVALLKETGSRFIEQHSDLLIKRAKQGWIRDVHGDLHCENICFSSEGIQIFDCIEFSSQFRQSDLVSEIAFLIMDLEARGAGSLVEPFLKRYRRVVADPDLLRLLPFYKSHRALIRGKVQLLRAAPGTAARYFRLAARFTWESFKPFLLIVCGLTGSGKSMLARELGERLGMPVINSDALRKSLMTEPGAQRVGFNTGIYSPWVTEKTYAKIAHRAEKEILNGTGAILDATFRAKVERERILRLARKHHIPCLVIRCFASAETTKRRLERRNTEGADVSDGRWEIYLRQVATAEPMDEVPPADRLELNTEQPADQLARESEQFLRRRLNMVLFDGVKRSPG